VGPRTSLDNLEKGKFLILPGFELQPFGRPARSQALYRLLLLIIIIMVMIIIIKIIKYIFVSWLQIRRPGFDSQHYQKKKM
jgi:hypothetical protein